MNERTKKFWVLFAFMIAGMTIGPIAQWMLGMSPPYTIIGILFRFIAGIGIGAAGIGFAMWRKWI